MAVALSALALAHAGCTAEIGEASAPGGDDVDRDDEGCELSGTTAGEGTIRLVYLVPSDREPDARHIVNLEQSLRHVQMWLRDRTPEKTSFLVHEQAVQVVETDHPASYYASNRVGGDPALDYWYNATADALAAVGGSFGDPDDVWVIYLAADPACGQINGTSTHVALFPENHLRGLVGDPRVAVCPGDAEDSHGRCRWVGLMALLVTRALDVPDAAGCADDDTATPCHDDLLGRLGYARYPAATLSSDQLEFLTGSPFVRGTGLSDCALACDAAAMP